MYKTFFFKKEERNMIFKIIFSKRHLPKCYKSLWTTLTVNTVEAVNERDKRILFGSYECLAFLG